MDLKLKPYWLTILFLYCGQSYAGWSLLAEDNVAKEFVNIETIEKVGNFVRMWNMSDFKSAQEVGNGRLYNSSKALQEYDCTNAKKRLISLIHYSNAMGQGTVAYFDSTAEDWRPITPGSLGEVHFNSACMAK